MVGFQERKRPFDDRPLPRGFMRKIEGIPVPERHEQRSRRADLLRNFAQKDDADCGDSAAFQFGGDQTDRLIAHRSDGDEECDVDAILDESLRGGRGGVAHEAARSGDRAHEREMALAHVGDTSVAREFVQPV